MSTGRGGDAGEAANGVGRHIETESRGTEEDGGPAVGPPTGWGMGSQGEAMEANVHRIARAERQDEVGLSHQKMSTLCSF